MSGNSFINIYKVDKDRYLHFLTTLTSEAQAAFSNYFQEGTVDGSSVYYAVKDSAFEEWFINDLQEEPGDESPNYMVFDFGEDITVYYSGYLGGDMISIPE